MTSLDLAFDDEYETTPQITNKKPKAKPQYEEYQEQSQQPVQQQTQIHQQQPPQQPYQPPKQTEKFTNYYPYQEQQQQIPLQRPQQSYQYSFWDRMVMSRREVMKLFILSIVIILGISLEKIGCHYINQYLSSNDLTNIQELLVRFSFPIIVFIILWIIKSL
jgi:hypothetical protein